MKKILFTLLTAFVSTTILAQGYNVRLQSNARQGFAYLTYYSGAGLNVEDSAAISNTGLAIFKGNKTLPPGIYAVVFPGKRLSADFLIGKNNTQQISIKADTNQLASMQVSGSAEDVLFREYQHYVAKQGKLLNDERAAYMSASNAADSALHEKNYKTYNAEITKPIMQS